ncbi:MAG TPA: restriction endonuclease [Gallionella sp.]|nr:restriction endonuclease [Gallionella sp.]
MARIPAEKPYLDVKDLQIDEWLELVFTPEKKRKFRFIDYEFPTDNLCHDYIASLSVRSDADIKNLLRCFLIPTGGLGHDSTILHLWCESDQLLKQIDTTEYGRRLIRGQAWEGITWILDLLPPWPQLAANALDAYIRAHAQVLPDGRFRGLCDVLTVIRAKYLSAIHPKEVMECLSPREFEFLIAALFRAKGYKVRVTSQSRDGGADVLCWKHEGMVVEKHLIECKHHTGKIGVPVVRQLAGVVSETGASKGVVVSSSSFSSPAIVFANKTGREGVRNFV